MSLSTAISTYSFACTAQIKIELIYNCSYSSVQSMMCAYLEEGGNLVPCILFASKYRLLLIYIATDIQPMIIAYG